MYNQKIIITVLVLFTFCIASAQDKFEIYGKLSNTVKDKLVVLSYQNSEGKDNSDTSVLKDGKFYFTGTTAYANKAFLSLLPVVKDTSKRQQPDYQVFYLEKGVYKVNGTDNIAHADITGTKSQSEYREFNNLFDMLLTQWRKLSSDAMVVLKAKDTAALKKLQAIGKPLHERMEAVLDSFIFAHPDSYVALDLVYENKTSVIDPVTFVPIYSAFNEQLLNSFTGKRLTAKYEKAMKIAVGNSFDFTQQDVNGNSFTLSSLQGKYVLIDFWASWCVPCRAENPNLLKAYNKLKNKNFEVVGISLDDDKASWLKAIEKDKLPWIQVSDLKGWKNDVAIKYGITAVPQNILVDPKGTIIAKNLRGEELYAELEKLIK